ncbi:hypothetical protein HDC37_002387 [Microbacterium sp. AK009]|uniref:Dabb family protein n=1 Tax=Microbacterium sp. AK009 TaxID=2723068 RepID=UPI0017BAA959|nr:Dabb family protein [Microbacterium sp. AK009]NYF17542.1 hypothetical protein [Microbacterium sp. AK009]
MLDTDPAFDEESENTMILHLVTFRWVDGVTDERVSALTEALLRMAEGIDVLRSYVAGANLHLRPGGADYAVAAVVDDAAALEAYLDHPLHAAVYSEHLGPMIADRSAVQLPLTSGTLT